MGDYPPSTRPSNGSSARARPPWPSSNPSPAVANPQGTGKRKFTHPPSRLSTHPHGRPRFARPVRNARDTGLSATDAGAELAAVLGLTLTGISRCASDLFYWSSSEVGLVRLSADLCGTSSMMPQKRNPIILERIRGLAGDAAGWGPANSGCCPLATSTDADQRYVHN